MTITVTGALIAALLGAAPGTTLADSSPPPMPESTTWQGWDSPGLHDAANFKVRTLEMDGQPIDEIIVPGRPPKDLKNPPVNIPAPTFTNPGSALENVPAFNWSYGCVATSVAMMMGYYDNTGYPNMYAGPTNGGVCPMTNSVWGYGQSPLAATSQGLDGRAAKGHVDDYWRAYGNCGTDPYYGSWAEHNPGDCTADFLGTNIYQMGNCDGATTFYFYTNGDPLYDYSGSEPARRDGCHGTKLFAQSRGYTVNANFSQYIVGFGGLTKGFTFEQYKSEIDAGRPVLIHVAGHTMLGFGYTDIGKIVYLHDTWDHYDHQMTWGENYQGLEHYGVTVIRLAPAGVAAPALTPGAGEYQSPVAVTVSCPTAGAVVRYTLNGSEPTESDNVATGPIPVDRNTTLKARAFKQDLPPSVAVSASYSFAPDAPVISPSGGTFDGPQSATISCPTPGAVIHYTTSGNDPASSDPVVMGPVAVTGTCTLKARAFVEGWSPGDSTSAAFTISADMTIGQIKTSPDYAQVHTTTGIVSAAFQDFFYITDATRSCGLRVSSPGHGFAAGTRMAVTGMTRTNADGERFIEASALTPCGQATVEPFVIRNAQVGGGDLFYSAVTGGGQKGITGGQGLNNIGQLVRTGGQVTACGQGYFRINDGTIAGEGLLVRWEGAVSPPGAVAYVTGVSSCYKNSPQTLPQVLLRSIEDLVLEDGGAITGTVLQGGAQIINQVTESSHPYPNNSNQIWTLTGPPGSTRMRVHFTKVEMEANYDHLYLKDAANNAIQTLSPRPALIDFWSDWVPGDSIQLTLVSDYSTNYYGFHADAYEAESTGVPQQGVQIQLGPSGEVVTTDEQGRYWFTGLSAGSYTLTPSHAGSGFSPTSATVAVQDGKLLSGVDFREN